MYSLFLLKEKNDKHVVYYYSLDKKDAPSDGEIELDLVTDTLNILKTATGDEEGVHARFMRGHVRRIAIGEGCPEKRFVAVG
jgi:outer membrane lipoprotein-sorting protein